MITSSYYPIVGGTEVQIEQMIPRLRNFGVDARVLTRRPRGSPPHEEHASTTIDRIRVPSSAGLGSIGFTALGTAFAFRHRREYDLLHAHSIMSPTTVSALGGVLTRTPRVVTLHATFEPERLLSKPLGATRLRLYPRVIDRFISINSDITRLLLEHRVPETSIVSIPNGIDTSRFRPAAGDERARLRGERWLPPDETVVVFVGRLHPIKQVDVLLRAWAELPAGYLVILGDGEERQQLERLTRELGIGHRVSFRGVVSDVDAYNRAADIFVLPSSSEGLSVAMLEAMASGLVPVATAVGGANDLIRDGTSGLLVSPGNVEALRDALGYAMANEVWRADASRAARATVEQRYDLDVVAEQLATLYRRVLRRR